MDSQHSQWSQNGSGAFCLDSLKKFSQFIEQTDGPVVSWQVGIILWFEGSSLPVPFCRVWGYIPYAGTLCKDERGVIETRAVL